MRRLIGRYIPTIVKTAIAAGIFYFLLAKGVIELQPLAELLVHHNLAILSAILLMGGLLVGASRWWILLRSAEIPMSLLNVVRLYLIGAFFSTWLPGAAGGDMARALYVVKGLESRRSTAVLTIALDRAFALWGLLGIAAMLAMSNWQSRELQPVLAYYIWLITGAILVCAVGGLAVYFIARFVHIPVWPRWAAKARPIAHQLGRAIVLIVGHKGAMLSCATLSIAASGLVALGIVIISSAFEFGPAPLVAALAGVIGNISSAVPLTPGGLGVGEAVFAKICLELGSNVGPYATIYLAFRIVMAVVGFCGALFWLTKNFPACPKTDLCKSD
ncbi:lysylphosphatidylglycerol synthase transmembrane domain-containing protein [Azonexus sp. IMCC34842]|uniref:lysylphosphatidylglycerol synthase transmembrane domain-containing protein n=1 Tax=Azonexus sp. IMCC34842 TaxID=3420950 RepID=UPI003D0A33ED